MVVVVLVVVLAHRDDAANGLRDLGLGAQRVLQRFDAGRPHRLRRCLQGDQIGDLVVGTDQLAAHQQVLDQLVAVLALLGGRLEEELGKARPIDGVLREVRGHRQVGHRGVDLRLDLAFHLLDAAVGHVAPRIRDVGGLLLAWCGGDIVIICVIYNISLN